MKNLKMTNQENNTDQSQGKRRFQITHETLGKFALLAFAVITFASISGCTDDTIVEPVIVDVPPPAPQGVYTIRGDNSVTVVWLPVEASDFDRYRIYRGFDSSNGSLFSLIGESFTESFVDDPVTNGTRYYYTVTAVDLAGFESLQSAEFGGASPRSDGFNIQLFTNDTDPNFSGFDLSAGNRVSFDDNRADFWIDRDLSGVLYINVDTIGASGAEFGDIQDMGYTADLDEIGSAPIPPTINGWSVLKYYEIVDGHTYIIWTQDDRFAKVRVTSQTATSVMIDYAYQSGVAQDGSGGEPELSPQIGGETDSPKQITVTKIDRSSGAYRTDTSQQPKNLGELGASQ